MTKTPQPECPECEKLAKVREEHSTQAIGSFLEFYLPRAGYTLCKYDESAEMFYRAGGNYERIIAESFGIDLDKVDDERKALLEWIREQNETE